MPTYDYVCEACQHSFEEFQSMTADILKKCPECKKNKLKRLIGIGGGIIFKGSGFYETDYRSNQYATDQKADQTKTKDKKAEKNTEVKSEKTIEPKPKKQTPDPSPKE